MLEYIIKSGLCLIVLFSFYKLFLESERFHAIKRVYLIMTVAISLILPLISFSYAVEIPAEDLGDSVALTSFSPTSVASDIPWWKEQLPIILLIIYICGFSVCCFRFYKNLSALIVEAKKNDQLKDLPYIYVLLGRKLAPHSFFQYIFLNKEEFNNDEIASAVMEHEKAHVDQKHSIDLLLLELIHMIFWFNPVFIFIKQSVKLNHEFLADHRVLQKAYNPLEYTNILFQYSSGHHHNSLSSPINHSLIKKRIIMITKSFSLRRLLLRSFIFLPVLGGCVYLFNEEIVAKPVLVNSETMNTISGITQQQDRTIKIKVEDEKILLNGKLVSLDNFSEEIDKLTEDWSREELKKPWFEIEFSSSNTNFIEKLNQEYRKSKLSKLSDTEFLAPSAIEVPGGTPPPPPPPPVRKRSGNTPPPPPPAPEYSKQELQREIIFSIKVKGDKLQVNGKETKLSDFSETLDELTVNKTIEELKISNFRMQIIDPEPGFMEKLNTEFEKTRLSQVTGHDILPPPPPPPPSVISDDNNHMNKAHRERAAEWKNMKDAEKRIISEERKRIKEIQKELDENRQLTQEERDKMGEDVKRKEDEIDRKMKDVERKQVEIRREHMELESEQIERDHENTPAPPPPPPNPIEEIDKIAEQGGSFYYNNKEVTAEQVKKIVSTKEDITIHVTGEKGKASKVEITDN